MLNLSKTGTKKFRTLRNAKNPKNMKKCERFERPNYFQSINLSKIRNMKMNITTGFELTATFFLENMPKYPKNLNGIKTV